MSLSRNHKSFLLGAKGKFCAVPTGANIDPRLSVRWRNKHGFKVALTVAHGMRHVHAANINLLGVTRLGDRDADTERFEFDDRSLRKILRRGTCLRRNRAEKA
jgi:hypothetical protein